MRVISLASGSKGNAYLVEEDGTALLVDCGLNYKTLSARLKAVPAPAVTSIAAILLTHSHDDHVGGLRVFLNKHPDVPVYANAMTAETVAVDHHIDDNAFACFENGQTFEIGPFSIRAFSIPHDTADPVGYLISASRTYFHGTDIGTPLDSVGLKLREADIAVLESNHDSVMLKSSQRPPSVIQRIWGPRGHLANDQAAELVRKFASPRLKALALAHLSRDCNAPHLAEGEMKTTLRALGRQDVALTVLPQDEIIVIAD